MKKLIVKKNEEIVVYEFIDKTMYNDTVIIFHVRDNKGRLLTLKMDADSNYEIRDDDAVADAENKKTRGETDGLLLLTKAERVLINKVVQDMQSGNHLIHPRSATYWKMYDEVSYAYAVKAKDRTTKQNQIFEYAMACSGLDEYRMFITKYHYNDEPMKPVEIRKLIYG